MKETKNARFRRVAEARVNKIIRMLRLLGNCSGTNTYAYDADAVEQIFTALQIELDQARKRFSENGRPGRKRFSLSQAPTPDTVSYPHITLPLPDGTHLRAVAYADTTYPAINLYLLRDGEPEELVCFAEYNSEHSPCHELCIGVYTSDAEDTQYYGPYRPERETEYGKVIDKSQAYEAYRLAWDDIAKLLSDQIKAVLGRRFLLRVWPEDQGYWGARALHGLFSVANLNRLLDAVQADAETRMETLPEDSEAVHGFGMTLGSLLLKAALQADWKCEMVEDDALWLIGFVSSETRPYTVSGLLRTLNSDTLMSAKEILTYLKDNDSTDRTLSDIRLRYYAAHGNELCWRYPICDGIHAGAFILATKDGYLSLPYNSMDEEDYEILVLDDAVFHDPASLTTFLSNWEDFSADLTDAMREMRRILEGGEEDA